MACGHPGNSPQGDSSYRASCTGGGTGFGGVHTGHAGQGGATGQAAGDAATEGEAFSGWVATGAQAAATAASRMAAGILKRWKTMWVIFLEMGVALCLLLLIVWWTWPKKRPKDEDKP